MYRDESRRLLNELMELLTAWIEDMNVAEQTGPVHDRLILTRECVRNTLDCFASVEQALEEAQPGKPCCSESRQVGAAGLRSKRSEVPNEC